MATVITTTLSNLQQCDKKLKERPLDFAKSDAAEDYYNLVSILSAASFHDHMATFVLSDTDNHPNF